MVQAGGVAPSRAPSGEPGTLLVAVVPAPSSNPQRPSKPGAAVISARMASWIWAGVRAVLFMLNEIRHAADIHRHDR